jgi:kynurenine formamidase
MSTRTRSRPPAPISFLILIVEGLRGLAKVPDSGLFLALPLRLAGGTGSPVRVLLLTE